MARHRTHSIEFKRQVAQDYLAGETLHSLARRHDLSRNLVRIWIQKFEGGALDDEAVAVDTIDAYEARIASLERLVGSQMQRHRMLPRSIPRYRGFTQALLAWCFS
jgi:transposase-like protein